MRDQGYKTGNGYFGILQGGAPQQPVVMRLLSALPLALQLEKAYDFAWNVHLVSAGIRSATLLERAEFLDMDDSVFNDTVAAILDVVSTQPNVATRMRSPEAETRQFLVYNRTKVTTQDVYDAIDMKDAEAMGRVLGFQCAGQTASPYSVVFFLNTRDTEKPVMFYAEMCNDEPDSKVTERQTNQFNKEANKFGWSVTSETKYAATIPIMVQQLLLDSQAVNMDKLLDHCENVGMLVSKSMLEQGLVLTTHTATLLAGLLAYLDSLIDVYAGQNNFTDFLSTYEAHVAEAERLVLMRETPTHVTPIGQVVAMVVAQQYDRLDTIGQHIMRLIKSTLKVHNVKTPRSPKQWDLLAALLAVHALHMPVQGMKDRMREDEQFALNYTLLTLDLLTE